MISISLKEGWSRLIRIPSILTLLIFYQIFWGIVLYAAVQTFVAPLIARIPLHEPNSAEFQMFLIESQFRLLKTSDAKLALIGFISLFIVRMLCTPLLNAGLFHVVQQSDSRTSTTKSDLALFGQGCKTHAASFYVLHFVQWFVYALPILGIILFADNFSLNTYLNDRSGLFITTIIFYILFANYVRLLFTYLLLGKSSFTDWKQSLTIFLRGIFTLTAISLLILLFYLIFYSTISIATVAMASLIALSIHFAAQGIRALFKTWEIAAHSRFFQRRLSE